MELYIYEQRITKLFELKRYDKAKEEIKKALSEHPQAASLFSLLAFSHQVAGENKAALNAYKEALSLDPDFAAVHKEVAALYLSAGDKKTAQHHIETALKLCPDDPEILAPASVIYSHIDPWLSSELMKRARTVDPMGDAVSTADAYHSLAAFKLGKFKRILIEKLAKDPASPKAMLGMGIVELSNGRFEHAEPLLRQAYVAEPDAGTLDAWIDARLGKYFPFNWTIPLGWIWYPFGLGFQVVFFLLILFAGLGAVIAEFPVAYAQWIWILHVIVAAFFSITYLIKYPVQYYFKRTYHSETSVFTTRDLFKAGLFISTLIYWAVIFTKDLSLLMGAVFILVYSPCLFLIIARKHIITRIFYLLIYVMAWCSFILSIVSYFSEIDFPKWVYFPMLLGWIALLLLSDAVEKLEDKLVPAIK